MRSHRKPDASKQQLTEVFKLAKQPQCWPSWLQEMVDFFRLRQDEFLDHYRKRSNVESTFSMIKRKFDKALRSKTETAMINETLCKLLCHNIVVSMPKMYEPSVDPTDW